MSSNFDAHAARIPTRAAHDPAHRSNAAVTGIAIEAAMMMPPAPLPAGAGAGGALLQQVAVSAAAVHVARAQSVLSLVVSLIIVPLQVVRVEHLDGGSMQQAAVSVAAVHAGVQPAGGFLQSVGPAQ